MGIIIIIISIIIIIIIIIIITPPVFGSPLPPSLPTPTRCPRKLPPSPPLPVSNLSVPAPSSLPCPCPWVLHPEKGGPSRRYWSGTFREKQSKKTGAEVLCSSGLCARGGRRWPLPAPPQTLPARERFHQTQTNIYIYIYIYTYVYRHPSGPLDLPLFGGDR